MNQQILQQYVRFSDFLAVFLGSSYEIVLQKIDRYQSGIIQIYHGEVSNRKIGDPLTDLSLSFIKNKTYIYNDYITSYTGKTFDNKRLVSGTFFIKNEKKELIGMLCINVDKTEDIEVINRLLSLQNISSEWLQQDSFSPKEVDMCSNEEEECLETFTDSLVDLIEKNILIPDYDKRKLSKSEKMAIITHLYRQHLFRMKGSISVVAEKMNMSESSLYRYLSVVKQENQV